MHTTTPDWLATGPFGLRMGMSGPDLGTVLSPMGPFWFSADTVPRPHPGFPIHGLSIAPTLGLARIQAVGVSIATAASGEALRAAFADVAADLAVVYGDADWYAGHPDHHSAPPQDWMAAMRRGEWALWACWPDAPGTVLPHHDLERVILTAEVDKGASGCLTLHCFFTNHAEAQAEIASWRILEDETYWLG